MLALTSGVLNTLCLRVLLTTAHLEVITEPEVLLEKYIEGLSLGTRIEEMNLILVPLS